MKDAHDRSTDANQRLSIVPHLLDLESDTEETVALAEEALVECMARLGPDDSTTLLLTNTLAAKYSRLTSFSDKLKRNRPQGVV